MTIEFSNCNYRWQLEETLKDIFDGMVFEVPEEFDMAAKALKGDKDQRIEFTALLSTQVLNQLNNAFEYLDFPEDHINASYLKVNLEKFGLVYDNIKDLTDNDLQDQCLEAHKKIVRDYFADKATYFESLTIQQRAKKIELKKQEILNKQIAREEAEAKKAQVSAPAPGSEGSTYNLFVTTLLGGEQRFKDILELLKAEPAISGCSDVLGNVNAVMTDEDGIRWAIELLGCSNDCGLLHIIVKNEDTLNFMPEDPEKAIRAHTLVHSITTNIIPSGEYHLSCATTKELLFNAIKQQLTCAFVLGFARAHRVEMDLIDNMINKMVHQNHFPSRTTLKDKVLALKQTPRQAPVPLDLLRQLLVVQIPNEENVEVVTAGANNPFLQMIGNILPFAALNMFRQQRAASPEREDEQPQDDNAPTSPRFDQGS